MANYNGSHISQHRTLASILLMCRVEGGLRGDLLFRGVGESPSGGRQLWRSAEPVADGEAGSLKARGRAGSLEPGGRGGAEAECRGECLNRAKARKPPTRQGCLTLAKARRRPCPPKLARSGQAGGSLPGVRNEGQQPEGRKAEGRSHGGEGT